MLPDYNWGVLEHISSMFKTFFFNIINYSDIYGVMGQFRPIYIHFHIKGMFQKHP